MFPYTLTAKRHVEIALDNARYYRAEAAESRRIAEFAVTKPMRQAALSNAVFYDKQAASYSSRALTYVEQVA